MKRSAATRQVVRYGLTGLVSNAIAYITYLLLTELGVGPRVAMTWVYLVAALVGYWGNKTWTFKFRGDHVFSVVRYIVAHVVGYVANWIMLTSFVNWLGVPHQLAQAAAIIVVATLLFIMYRAYVFAQPLRRHEHLARMEEP